MAYRRDQPVAPKPYGFTPLIPLSPQDREMPKGHDHYYDGTVNGYLEATLIVATPLHVASGQMTLRPGQTPSLVRGLTRVNGQPCIPASTLKGVVRSAVEAITRSCVRITLERDLPSGAAGCKNKQKLCLACRMFGALGFEGHVRFDDAVLKGEEQQAIKIARMPALYQPRNRSGAYRDARGNLKGRKFYMHGRTVVNAATPVEIFVPESQLAVKVRFENLTPGELGVLLTALGLGKPALTLKIGGGKPACYGSAVVVPNKLAVWEAAKALYGDYDAASTAGDDTERYVQAATGLILPEHLKRLAEVWAYDMKRECPGGNY